MFTWNLVGGRVDEREAVISIDTGAHIVMYRAALVDGVFAFRDEHGDRLMTKDPTPDELRALLRCVVR